MRALVQIRLGQLVAELNGLIEEAYESIVDDSEGVTAVPDERSSESGA